MIYTKVHSLITKMNVEACIVLHVVVYIDLCLCEVYWKKVLMMNTGDTGYVSTYILLQWSPRCPHGRLYRALPDFVISAI